MAVRDDRGDVKQTTTGFRVLLMVQSLTSAKSKFLSLNSLGSFGDQTIGMMAKLYQLGKIEGLRAAKKVKLRIK